MGPNLLVLGGTTEATALAQRLAETGVQAVFSYAGRVARPKAQPLPTRTGGFGGAEGLASYIRDHQITHVVDATHPFAAQMSVNAITACHVTGTPLVALTRPPWQAQAGDHWHHVGSVAEAVEWLDQPSRRVMLAIGRMHLEAFRPQGQHFYLLRVVDPPEVPIDLPDHAVVVGVGPFTRDDDAALMRQHGIDLIVSKNAGGSAARAKIDAARDLGLEVLMIDRPALPDRGELHEIDAVLRWCHAETVSGTERGV
ncbi:MAG: cobalt-precorrin-6A reductase [Paracoccaceae bacterium]